MKFRVEKCEVLVKEAAEHNFSLKLEQLTTKVLQQNSNRHKRVELWAKSIKDFGNFGRHFSCATSAKILAACSACAASDGTICSKKRQIVPYHGTNPYNRKGARLRSPSPIMAPVIVYHQTFTK